MRVTVKTIDESVFALPKCEMFITSCHTKLLNAKMAVMVTVKMIINGGGDAGTNFLSPTEPQSSCSMKKFMIVMILKMLKMTIMIM